MAFPAGLPPSPHKSVDFMDIHPQEVNLNPIPNSTKKMEFQLQHLYSIPGPNQMFAKPYRDHSTFLFLHQNSWAPILRYGDYAYC